MTHSVGAHHLLVVLEVTVCNKRKKFTCNGHALIPFVRCWILGENPDVSIAFLADCAPYAVAAAIMHPTPTRRST